jgi:transcriptional regulator with XRE-family HTH domain
MIAWRKARGLTQVKLARLLGVEPSTLSRIESGGSEPGLQLAARLAMLTDGAVSVTSWVDQREPQSPAGAA